MADKKLVDFTVLAATLAKHCHCILLLLKSILMPSNFKANEIYYFW